MDERNEPYFFPDLPALFNQKIRHFAGGSHERQGVSLPAKHQQVSNREANVPPQSVDTFFPNPAISA